MQRLILLLIWLSSIQLTGCQQLTTVKDTFFPTTPEEREKIPQSPQPSDSEVQSLLHQTHLDPLTRYIEIHQNNKNKFEQVQKIRQERDKRCLQLAQRYAKVEKTAKNLTQLRENYNYSCPRVVSDFAATVTTALAGKQKPAEDPPKKTQPLDATVQKLLRQKYIDPLVQYIEKYQNDPTKIESISLVKAEREKRCAKVAAEYAKKNPNQNTLNRLTKGYQQACPQVITDFAQKTPSSALAVPSKPQSPLSPPPVEDPQKTASPATLQACTTALEQQDYLIAFAQCKPLAEQGNAKVQYTLALMYSEGKGVDKDPAAALHWLQQAAQQNVTEAQLLMGRKYYTGEDVAKDFTQATQWYRRAAEQGSADAQYLLGVMYELGQGVPQDFVSAYQFFLLAAAQGHSAAMTSRNEMDSKLSAEQIAEGQRLAREWAKQHTLP